MEKLKEVGVLMWILLAVYYIFFMAWPQLAHADECDTTSVKATIFLPSSTAARCEVKADKIEYMLIQVMDQPEGNRAKIAGLMKNPNLLPNQQIRLLSLPEEFTASKTRPVIVAASDLN